MSKSKSKAEEALQFLDDLDFSVDDVPPASEDEEEPAASAAAAEPNPSSSAAAAATTAAGSKATKAAVPQVKVADAAPVPAAATTKGDSTAADGQEAEDALKFLDDLTQKSSTVARPLSRGPTSSSAARPSASKPAASPAAAAAVVAGARADAPPPSSSATAASPSPVEPSAKATGKASINNEPLNIPSPSPVASSSAGGWGSWGASSTSLWSTASSALSAARSTASSLQREASSNLASSLGDVAAELRPGESVEGVKEDARKWGLGGLGRVKELVEKGREVAGGVDLEKLRHDLLAASQTGLTQLLNTIAPPIAEHEVLSIVLSADLAGYDGLDGVVYKGLARVLEQVEGGELVVRSAARGEEAELAAREGKRELFAVEGWEKAYELAESSIARLIEQAAGESTASEPKGPTADLPVHSTSVYLRIQPVLHRSPFSSPSSAAGGKAAPSSVPDQLSFLLHLVDPSHALTHTTQSQPIPSAWLAVDWETNPWVEERLVDALRVGVEVVGEGYVMERMGVVGASSGASGRATPRTATTGEEPAAAVVVEGKAE